MQRLVQKLLCDNIWGQIKRHEKAGGEVGKGKEQSCGVLLLHAAHLPINMFPPVFCIYAAFPFVFTKIRSITATSCTTKDHSRVGFALTGVAS